MRRRLFTLLSALSLLLCVGTCVLWARSYWHTDKLTYRRLAQYDSHLSPKLERVERLCSAWSRRGRFVAWSQPNAIVPKARTDWQIQSYGQERFWTTDKPPSSFLGFSWVRSPQPYVYAIVPCWAIALVTGALPSVWIIRVWTNRRWRPGLCASCGYDLRATPDRCPECGMETKKPAGVADVDKRTV